MYLCFITFTAGGMASQAAEQEPDIEHTIVTIYFCWTHLFRVLETLLLYTPKELENSPLPAMILCLFSFHSLHLVGILQWWSWLQWLKWKNQSSCWTSQNEEISWNLIPAAVPGWLEIVPFPGPQGKGMRKVIRDWIAFLSLLRGRTSLYPANHEHD